jgi:hypothetical protein
MSIGNQEDTKAFREMVRRFYEAGPPSPARKSWASWPTVTDGLRYGFEAGMQRGEQKRGCCATISEAKPSPCCGQPDLEGCCRC